MVNLSYFEVNGKNNPGTHYIANLSIHLAPAEIKRWGVTLQYAADGSRLYCRMLHFIIIEKQTQGLFTILDYSFLRSTDIAQILKKLRRVLSHKLYRQITSSQCQRYCTFLCNNEAKANIIEFYHSETKKCPSLMTPT